MRLSTLLLFAALGAGAQQLREVRVPFAGKELTYVCAASASAAGPAPLLVLLHPDTGADLAAIRRFATNWQGAPARRRWHMIVPWAKATGLAINDAGVEATEAIVEDAKVRFQVDSGRVYLAGIGEGGSQVFYLASRVPDLWTAAVAVEGSPRAAMASNRLFGANTSLVPILWSVRLSDHATALPLSQTLTTAGYNVQLQSSAGIAIDHVLEWLAKHRREEFPRKVDCESGDNRFGRCYWVEMTRFDPSLRNDVLRSTRVPPGTRAFLSIGSFGFNPSAPGPGVLIQYLPPGFKGPLTQGDRIVALAGREIRDGQHYMKMLEEMKEEKPVALMIERAGKRQRVETRIVLPKREEINTARIQVEYVPNKDEIQVLSRGVAEARMTLPQNWAPVAVNWNGNDAGRITKPGCWVISLSAPARPCVP